MTLSLLGSVVEGISKRIYGDYPAATNCFYCSLLIHVFSFSKKFISFIDHIQNKKFEQYLILQISSFFPIPIK